MSHYFSVLETIGSFGSVHVLYHRVRGVRGLASIDDSDEQGSRKLVSVVSRILDNCGLVRQSGSKTMSD